MTEKEKPTLEYGSDQPQPKSERWALIIAFVAAASFIGGIFSLFEDALSIVALILVLAGIVMIVSSFLGPSRPVLLFCGGAVSTFLGGFIFWLFWCERKE